MVMGENWVAKVDSSWASWMKGGDGLRRIVAGAIEQLLNDMSSCTFSVARGLF